MDVNSLALRAAALFTSNEHDREILHSVQVSDNGTLIMATDSYMACAVGLQDESPSELVARVIASGDGDDEAVLILQSDIAKANKLAPKTLTYWDVTPGQIALPGTAVVETSLPTGTFPSISSLFKDSKPAAIDDIAFDAGKLAVFHKAAQALYGRNTPKMGECLPRLVFHGAAHSRKPALFSLYGGEGGTMVILLCPVTGFVGWDGKQ